MRTTETIPFSRSREALFVLLGAGLMTLMSQITIPLKPVPITFQTVGLLIIGLTYSPRQAFLSFATYLGLGALGAPIFSSFSGGPSALLGASAGYFFGFLIVGTSMAWVREKLSLKTPLALIFLCLAGQALLYVLGVGWLSLSIPFKTAIAVGVMPFILPGIAKVIITAGLLGYLKKSSSESSE